MLKFKKESGSLMMSEINIIPFTDILLVVLIAFIVTTPLLVQSAIKVKLPRTELNSPVSKGKIVHITVAQTGIVYVNDKEVSDMNALYLKLHELGIAEKVLVVNADENVNYGLVAKVLGTVKELGTQKLELAIDNKEE